MSGGRKQQTSEKESPYIGTCRDLSSPERWTRVGFHYIPQAWPSFRIRHIGAVWNRKHRMDWLPTVKLEGQARSREVISFIATHLI